MTAHLVDLLFVALALVYLWFGSKVDEWITISTLGFKLETPQGFLERPRAYDAIRIGLLLAACASLFEAEVIQWYLGVVLIAGAWLSTTWLGQRRAFATYRRLWHEGITDAETSNDKAWRVAESQKSNAELRDRLLGLRTSQ